MFNHKKSFREGLQSFYLVLIVAALFVVIGCANTISIDRSQDNRETHHEYPLHSDSTVAAVAEMVGEENLDVALQYHDYLFNLRQHRFYFTSKVGESFVIQYYGSSVVYAAILSKNNEVQEDIVFYQGEWYYNGSGQHMESITESQAMLFVENIQKRVATIEDEEGEDS